MLQRLETGSIQINIHFEGFASAQTATTLFAGESTHKVCSGSYPPEAREALQPIVLSFATQRLP